MTDGFRRLEISVRILSTTDQQHIFVCLPSEGSDLKSQPGSPNAAFDFLREMTHSEHKLLHFLGVSDGIVDQPTEQHIVGCEWIRIPAGGSSDWVDLTPFKSNLRFSPQHLLCGFVRPGQVSERGILPEVVSW